MRKKNLYPKISILTPSFNQGNFLEENIKSVLEQRYDNFEHIIIDGKSSDQTISILKKYKHLKWISEPDRGQADALNKGLAMATGDIIGWINSDDYYLKNIFKEVINEFQESNAEWLVGKFIGRDERINKFFYPKFSKYPVTYENLLDINKQIICQQSTFIKRSLIYEAGRWNSKYYMVMDLDLWIRMSKISKPKMVERNWAVFRWHDNQKSNLKNWTLQIKEIDEILKNEGISVQNLLKYRLRMIEKFIKSKTKGFLKNMLYKFGILDKKYLHMSLINKGRYFD